MKIYGLQIVGNGSSARLAISEIKRNDEDGGWVSDGLVLETAEAPTWLAAKAAFGYTLTPLQTRIRAAELFLGDQSISEAESSGELVYRNDWKYDVWAALRRVAEMGREVA